MEVRAGSSIRREDCLIRIRCIGDLLSLIDDVLALLGQGRLNIQYDTSAPVGASNEGLCGIAKRKGSSRSEATMLFEERKYQDRFLLVSYECHGQNEVTMNNSGDPRPDFGGLEEGNAAFNNPISIKRRPPV
jgi:hypothetical protein